jgi:DNA repair protein RadD
MIQLRDYQQTAIEAVRAQFRAGKRSVLMVMPTGAGKTVAFSYVTQGAQTLGKRVWLLAHRIELVEQISETLKQFGVHHGFIAAGYRQNPSRLAQVASVQTLVRRTQSHHAPDLIVVDEAHHATAKNTIGTILKAYPRARVLGVTATPVRLSGEGLGETFNSMVLGPTVQELIDAGALSPVTIYAPPTMDTSLLHLRAGEFIHSEVSALVDKPKITGSAVEHYKRLADKKRAVAFCVSVDHARNVAAEFTRAGYSAMYVDGSMERASRKDAVSRFKEGKIHVLTSCDLISEGFDCPGIEVGISLRPTASLGLWLQQVGRCLRVFEGKDRATILDHAGNTLRHGLPTDERQWSLEGRERSTRATKDDAALAVRVCPQCFSADKSGKPACVHCGHVYPIAGRKLTEVEGELKEIKAVNPKRREQGQAQSVEALTELAVMRGYSNPRKWAEYVYKGRMAKRRA